MFNYQEFVSQKKSMLIAPAGFGKTHTIAECLKHTPDQEKQLILTHTHAGIASIKEKIKKQEIPNLKYHVETITGFAQKYVLAFYTGNDIPDQENNKEYYPFIIEKATELLKYNSIKKVVSETYNGLFVDEYQDCTLKQHELIIVLSSLFNTRILGDHMQGIFGFNETLVNLDDSTKFSEFAEYELETPWRWIKGKNPDLGEALKQIRNLLEKKQSINLADFSSEIQIYKMKKSDEFYTFKIKDSSGVEIRNPQTQAIWSLKSEKSLLILFPNDDKNKSTAPREIFVKFFGDNFYLVEAIDEKNFYKLAKQFDNITSKSIEKNIKAFLLKCFTKKSIDYWFKDASKRTEQEGQLFTPIQTNLTSLKTEINISLIAKTLKMIYSLPKMKCFRKDLFHSCHKAMSESAINNSTIHEAMINKRNSIRRMGKKVIGKCVGTTLLTKGLEFDTVVILNAHNFNCMKHLYVALTRASKKLIIFTENEKITLN